MRMKSAIWWGAAAVAAVLCAGCGGGGGAAGPVPAGTTQVDTGRGTVSVALKFTSKPTTKAAAPALKAGRGAHATRAFGGNIPYGALSVRVTLTNPTTGAELAPPRIVIAPADNGGLNPLVTIQYASLPVGPVRIDVAAFSRHDAGGNALANGSVTGNVLPAQLTTLSVPMTLTVARISVNPDNVRLGTDGDRATITATALDANGQAVDFPLIAISGDPDIANANVDPTAPTQVLITSGLARGLTNIVVFEPNSGLSAAIQVSVENL